MPTITLTQMSPVTLREHSLLRILSDGRPFSVRIMFANGAVTHVTAHKVDGKWHISTARHWQPAT